MREHDQDTKDHGADGDNGNDNDNDVKNLLDLLQDSTDTVRRLLCEEEEETLTTALRRTTQCLFGRMERYAAWQASFSQSSSSSSLWNAPRGLLSGLSEIYLGDAETIWGQVDLQNEAALTLLQTSVRQLARQLEKQSNRASFLRLVQLEKEGGQDDEDNEEDDDDGSDNDNDDDDDSEVVRMRKRMERAMAEAEEEDEEEEESWKRLENEKKKKKEEEEDPAAEELNDGFFDLHELEKFADEEEDLLPQDDEDDDEDQGDKKKKMSSRARFDDNDDEEQEEEEEEDDDEEFDDLYQEKKPADKSVAGRRNQKYRNDEDIEALYSLYEAPHNDDDDVDDELDAAANMTAADFFGQPSRHNKKGMPSLDDGEDWELPEEENDDNEDKSEWNTDSAKPAAKGKDRLSKKEDNDDDDDDDAVDKDDDNANKQASSYSQQALKLERQTMEMEREFLAEKPWQMTGETKGTARPVNSLLDATPEFSFATKMAPPITAQHTLSIEQVIKKRILEEDWDNVLPRELPDIFSQHKKKKEAPMVSQERSPLGLGELYERDYLRKTTGVDPAAAEQDAQDARIQGELKSLFASICRRLDALSHYHFTPRPVADEAEITPATATPAIAMEEAIPLHVSDARAAAPEEVYGAKQGRDSVLKGESERNQTERKRRRSAKKAARRQARKEKEADEKLLSRLQPGLGLHNPYERRKLQEELSMARARGRVVTATKEEAGGSYSGSSKFFQSLQDTVKRSIAETTQDDDDKGRKRQKRGDTPKTSSSRSFKM